MPVSLAPSGDNGGGDPANSNVVAKENAGNDPAKVVVAPGATDNGGGGNSGDWLAGLSPENKAIATQKGWKSGDDALKSYTELQTQFSARDPGKANQFRLGDYAFAAPTDEAAKKLYSPERAESFKQFAQKTGVAPEMAAAVHDWFVTSQVAEVMKSQEGANAALNESFEKASAQLTKSWGVETTPAFKRNAEMAFRAVRELGLTDALVEVGALNRGPKGELNVVNAAIVEALAKVGNGMYAEDTQFGSSSVDRNPFAVGTAAENSTDAGRIMKEDPDKAEALIRAAGPAAVNFWQHWLNGRKK